jgi:quinol monooxygenase YgiN
MTEPFFYIGTHRLKEGRLAAFRESCRDLVEFVAANEPRLIAFNVYADTQGDEVSIVQVHPDADSMVAHMQLLEEHIAEAHGEDSPLAATTSIQVHGAPTDEVLETIGRLSPGVPLIVKAQPLAGFTRAAPEQAPAAS